MSDRKERTHYVNIVLDGHEKFSIKIPDQMVDEIYDAEAIQFNIDVEEIDRHSILTKSDKWKLKK